MTVWRIYQLAPVTWPDGDRQGNPAGRGTSQREASAVQARRVTETERNHATLAGLEQAFIGYTHSWKGRTWFR